MSIFTQEDENRLRELANGMAKDVEHPDALLQRLGFTREDYNELAETRTFKSLMDQALSEWSGASNTHKRIKLKAAISIEEALPHFHQAMTSVTEPLSSKVKAFEVVARIGGLGNPEIQAPGGGQFFKLEINLGGGRQETVRLGEEIVGQVIEEVPSPPSVSHTPTSGRERLSRVFDGESAGDW